MIFENRLILDMSEAEYHADPCVKASLSSSIAKMLLAKSPMHAHHIHPRLGGHAKETSDALDFGGIVHALTLGKGKGFEVLDVDAYRSNADKALRDAAIAKGLTPIKRKDYGVAERVAEALRNRLRLTGENEVTILWSTNASDEAGTEIQCRSRIDNLTEENGFAVINEIKTTGIGADVDAMTRAVEPGGQDYCVQMFSQILAVEKVCPQFQGRVKYRWLFVETEAPYGIQAAEPTGSMMALGAMRWGRAVNKWAQCIASGKWPGYPTEVARLEPRDFTMSREEAIAHESL